MSDVLFNRDIANFVTIVRTNSQAYDNPDVCQRDIAEMRGEGGRDLSPAQKRLAHDASRILHVDMPPARYSPEARQHAREVLIARLASCDEAYNPPALQAMNSRIGAFVEEERAAERMAEQLRQQVQQLESAVKNAKSETERVAAEIARAHAQQKEAEERARAAEARAKEVEAMKRPEVHHHHYEDEGSCTIL